jgi:hypothetical protein
VSEGSWCSELLVCAGREKFARLVRKRGRWCAHDSGWAGGLLTSDVWPWARFLSCQNGAVRIISRLVGGDLVVAEDYQGTDLLSKRIGVREGKPGAVKVARRRASQ